MSAPARHQPEPAAQEVLAGLVERVTFHNSDNGFCVLRAKARGHRDLAVSPITSGLPRSWDTVNVGHMVLAHESPDDGWWEAVVIKREDDILTLRYRDAPKLPTFIRHVTTVALVNPGLLPEES